MTRPARSDQFTLLRWEQTPDTPELCFHYHCNLHGAFTERARFPLTPEKLAKLIDGPGAGLIDLLHVAMGVSYYKVGAAKRLTLPYRKPAAVRMAHALYTEGLAEFYVRADLPYPADMAIEPDVSEVVPQAMTIKEGPALVAFGGGKDSYVARHLVQSAGDEAVPCAVILSDAVRKAIQATAPEPVTFLERELDPRLKDVTPNGFNGHVPITAINMLMLSIFASMADYSQVIFANERSADEPTMDVDGIKANHQYSKSSDFEQLIQQAVLEADPMAPVAYSLLRPFSELWIGRQFAQLKAPFERFTSCNRNFRLAGDATKRWCGECAKCAFTSLILAPFITEHEAKKIFGENFLDREQLQPLYHELCGLSDQKPWDCVGTIDECRAALWSVSKQPSWSKALAVRTLTPKLLELTDDARLARAWTTALQFDTPPHIPKDYMMVAKETWR